MQDKLDCPYCGYLYEEEFVESVMNSSFKCERCEGKVRVKLNPRGYILMQRRVDRMHYAKVKQQRLEDYVYLDKIKKQYIVDTTGSYTEESSDIFFKHGKCEWVRQARLMFSEDARMVGIPLQTIVNYFKSNNGLIDYRTIQYYERNN
jgi:DNA-directed RNA polymerase subunit RPC12/RpoP